MLMTDVTGRGLDHKQCVNESIMRLTVGTNSSNADECILMNYSSAK